MGSEPGSVQNPGSRGEPEWRAGAPL